MADIENLSSEELESALNKEIAELGWDWETAPEIEPKVEAWSDMDDTDTDWDDNNDDETLSKTERKIKKLLAQRNEERDAKAKLEIELAELKNNNADSKFFTENPWADKFKEQIAKEMEETVGLSMDKAYKIVASSEILANKQTANIWNRAIVWNTPWANTSDKKPADMSSSELDAQVRELYWKGSIKI